MMMGHYATALVAYENIDRVEKPPFWLLLIATQFLDILMILFVTLGVEHYNPNNFLDFTFESAKTYLFFSHSVIAVFFWSLLFGSIVFAFLKKKSIAIWCFGLCFFHEICDMLIGFAPTLYGKDSPIVGAELYNNSPIFSMIAESILCATLIIWFIGVRKARGVTTSKKLSYGLYGILVGVTLANIPLAVMSIRSILF